MCTAADGLVQDAIGAAGGMRVVVEALRQHPQVFDVQNWGTYALQRLVQGHAANQVRGRWTHSERKMRR